MSEPQATKGQGEVGLQPPLKPSQTDIEQVNKVSEKAKIQDSSKRKGYQDERQRTSSNRRYKGKISEHVDTPHVRGKHGRQKDERALNQEEAKTEPRTEGSEREGKRLECDEGRKGKHTRRGYSGQRPHSQARPESERSDKTQQSGRPKATGKSKDKAADHVSKYTDKDGGGREKREECDEARKGKHTRGGHSGQRPHSQPRPGSEHSDRASHSGRPKVRGKANDKATDDVSKSTNRASGKHEKRESKSQHAKFTNNLAVHGKGEIKNPPAEEDTQLPSGHPRVAPKPHAASTPHEASKSHIAPKSHVVPKTRVTPNSKSHVASNGHVAQNHKSHAASNSHVTLKSQPKAGRSTSAPNATATHHQSRRYSDQQGMNSKSSHHQFRKFSEGDAKQGRKEEEERQMLHTQRNRHSPHNRQYLYKLQLRHMPEMDTRQFHTVFANHPGFDHASIEFEGGSKGFVYFATRKDAENFSRSVRTVGEPKRVDREPVEKKTLPQEKKPRTFEDKLVALARQIDSGVRKISANHDEKVKEIAVKVNDIRPSGRFVSIDVHTLLQQQRKVLQMKQDELTKQREEFDQTIQTISGELVSLSPDDATRATLLQLLGRRLGGAEISTDTVEVKSKSENASCTRASDSAQVHQRVVSDPHGVEDRCEAEPTTQVPAEADGNLNVNNDVESVSSLVEGTQDLLEGNQIDEGKTSMSDEGEMHPDEPAEEKTLYSTSKNAEEQNKIINDSVEVADSLVGDAQDLVNDEETDVVKTSLPPGEGEMRPDVQAKEEIPQPPTKSQEEQTKILNESLEGAVSLDDSAQDLFKDMQTGEGKIHLHVEAEEEILQHPPKSPEEQNKMLNDLTSRNPNMNKSVESVDNVQNLAENNQIDEIQMSMSLDECEMRPDEEKIPQSTCKSPAEQNKILSDLKSRYLRECSRFQAALPMYAYRTKLLQEVKRNGVIVVVAETGSGKSTQIVQYLADNFSEPGKLVACTQPRKIAAMSLADRVAAEYGCRVGEEIGYAVGSKRRVSGRTKAVFMTDQVLLNSCVKEGELDKYSCIIIDEAHERSIHTDLLLGILKKSIQTRPGLRLVIASATIDPTLFSNYFVGCPVMSVPGRTFPVDVIYKTPQFGDNNSSVDFVSETVNKVVEIHNNESEGDILAFLTSPLEIERACERTTNLLGSRVKSALVLPLHGKLQPEDQRKVFEPAPAGARKVVFATNIAETSVTIPGIIYVVDSGMIKERYFDAKRNLSVLDVKMVAQSSAIQRAGRAGRIQPGTCYRLYTEEEFIEMRKSTPPEILRMHLGMAVLKLMELGVTDVTDFDFVERPSDDALQDAILQLDILGAIEKTEGDIFPELSGLGRSEPEAVVTDQSEETTKSSQNSNEASTKLGFGSLVDYWVGQMFWGREKQTEEPRMEDKPQGKEEPRTSIRLTELGKKMSQLPTEPRLSKMILEGVNQGCGKEALLVAALASAAGSVYFRAGTEEEKATADRQKMKFCHEGGDLLSMLDVYRDWVAQTPAQRSKWCLTNSINAKTMRLAEESFKEMKHHLASSGVNIPEDFAPVETVNAKLPRLILGAYCNNLCVFSGHERAGYIVGRLRQCVHIHPSSALTHLGVQHKWVVFDEILRTSRDFIINVTPVDVEWLADVASRYASKVDLRSLERSTMTSCLIKGYGSEVLRGMIGRRAQTLKSLEAVVSDNEKHLCVIEVDTDRCQVAVFTTQDRLEDGEKIVRAAMDAKHNDLKNESDEILVVNHRGDGTRMVLGKGGEVQDILMSSEFRCVDVFYSHTGNGVGDCTGIMDMFTSLDDVLIRTAFDRILTTAAGQRVGVLTFSSYRVAQETVNRYDKQPFGEGTLVLRPVNQSRGPGGGGPQQVVLNVMWFRRECRGFGFVECEDIMDPEPDDGVEDDDFMDYEPRGVEAQRVVADINGKPIEGGHGIITASVNRTKVSSVYVRGPASSLNEQTLEMTVRRNSVVVPLRYSVVWKPQTSPVDTERDEARLQELFESYVVHGTMRVSVNKPKPESQVRGYAIVTMSDESDAQSAVQGLHNKRDVMGTQALSVQRKLQCSVVCNTKIYDVLEDKLRDTIVELTQGGSGLVKIASKRAKSGKSVYFNLSGSDVEEVARAKSRLHDVMRPETVAHEDPTVTCRLFDKLGLAFIQTVRNRVRGVHIDADRRTFTVGLYGKDEPRQEAKRLISDYLDSLAVHTPREIPLAGNGRPAGVMKALLNKYGLNLDGLKDVTGAREIRLDMRKHLLIVQESDETFNKVKEGVDAIAKEILERKGESCQRETEDDSKDCGICSCSLDDKDYRLQCCGHRYCYECVKHQLTSAIRSQEFPIRCATDGCSRDFFLRDLRLLLNQADFRQLVTGSLNAFVNKSGGRYRPCPTPDCLTVYRSVTEDEGEGHVFQCCVCDKRLCTRCHVDMHDGMSCATWQIFKGDPDDTLRDWMKDKTDVKHCPKCNWVIEKNEGCNHMTCKCGAHICWICLKTFDDGGDCYSHTVRCTGNFQNDI
ncbi:uncharacterized protein LOC144886044 [Branchiostoma floridae x Branchiostoma japonicum]